MTYRFRSIFNARKPAMMRLACMVLLFSMGCMGEDNGLRTVSGTATLDGNPLPSGTVGLVDEAGVPAGIGMIHNGEFEIAQSANINGVKPGSYQVTVESWEQEPGAVLEDGSMAAGKRATPKKYGDFKTSGLSIEVPEDGIRDVRLELTSE